MKKSIKYAGVAAATLLAVAPVAAPVLSSSVTTTVKADATLDTNIANAASTYTNQLTNQSLPVAAEGVTGNTLPVLADVLATTTTTGTGEDATTTPTDVKYNAEKNTYTMPASTFLSSALATVNNTPGGNSLNYLKNNDSSDAAVQAIVTVNNTDGSQANQNDLSVIDAKAQGYTFNVSFSYVDANGKTQTTKPKAVTYSVPSTPADTTVKKAAATFETSKDVEYGSSVYDTQLANTSDFAIKDSDGNDITSFTVKPDSSYYTSVKAAVAGTDPVTDLGNSQTTNFETGDTTYYQKVTVTASGDLATFLAALDADTDGTYTLSYNGVDSTDQTKTTSTDTTITYVRAINVGSKEAADWTTTDETGVVTTKTDKTYYTMKNDDNKTISNRALAANTSWKYDQVRTNSNGDKQYRVSTHEWVPAESVTVNGSDDNNGGSETPEGALTVTNLDTKGVVSLATPGMTYFVYNKEGVMSTTRALAGGSSWLVDKTATDANGNTYYGVSTDEFVKAGEGVSFTA